jgi:hypothetical protein
MHRKHFDYIPTHTLLFSPLHLPLLYPTYVHASFFFPSELDYTHGRKHAVFDFLNPDYFAEHGNLQFHPFSCKGHNFILLCGWIILHGVCMFSLRIHLLTGIWAESIIWLLWMDFDQRGNTVFPLYADLHYLEYMPKSHVAESSSRTIFIFLRNLHTDFYTGCTNLHFHQQWKG